MCVHVVQLLSELLESWHLFRPLQLCRHSINYKCWNPSKLSKSKHCGKLFPFVLLVYRFFMSFEGFAKQCNKNVCTYWLVVNVEDEKKRRKIFLKAINCGEEISYLVPLESFFVEAGSDLWRGTKDQNLMETLAFLLTPKRHVRFNKEN